MRSHSIALLSPLLQACDLDKRFGASSAAAAPPASISSLSAAASPGLFSAASHTSRCSDDDVFFALFAPSLDRNHRAVAASASVLITDPNALIVAGVSPSVLPSSGGDFPATSSVVAIKIEGANSVIAYQVDYDISGTFSRVRFFSPPVAKGNSGFSISINGIEKVSVLSRSLLSFTVVDLILSGFCTSSSIPAFGNMKASCFVKNLPPATSPGCKVRLNSLMCGLTTRLW
jgi:hypothetical protein